MMMQRLIRPLSIVAAAASLYLCLGGIIGCSGSTDVSSQPSKNEIEEAKQRRMKAIDDTPGLSPEQKERMKQQIGGQVPTQGQTRKEGLEKK